MARIRTIKPEFFTSIDIIELSVYARILYIALWCEADRDGRMEWKPKTFKLRYLAGDSVDVEALCREIVNAGLVVLYGEHNEYAYIPKFAVHQHINPREAASRLPDPTEFDASATRQPRVSDAQVGKEGKGRERKGKEGGKHDETPCADELRLIVVDPERDTPFERIALVLEEVNGSPPAQRDVTRHMSATQPLRRLVESLGVQGTLEIHRWAVQNWKSTPTWSSLWEQRGSIRQKIESGGSRLKSSLELAQEVFG